MKALKEKRISLRTLWRRSLVILSLLALVFASCGGSGGDSTTPNTPTTPVVTKTVISAQLLEYTEAEKALDGMPVDLKGFRALVRYNDGTVATFTDGKNMFMYPPVYDYAINGGTTVTTVTADKPDNVYTLYYVEGAVTFPVAAFAFDQSDATFTQKRDGADVKPWAGNTYTFPAATSTGLSIFDLGLCYRLVDVHVTGSLSKQKYFVDDPVTFAGVAVEGVYDENDVSGKRGEGAGSAPNPGVTGTQEDLFHSVIPLAQYPEYYEWRFVYNSGTYVTDEPGIVLKVGSRGNLSSGNTPDTQLVGLKLKIEELYQVSKVEFDPAPAFTAHNIFIDDKSLIGSDADGFNITKWTGVVLADAKVKVSYTGTTETKSWGMEEMGTINSGFGVNSGGVWEVPTLGFYIPEDLDTANGDWEVSAHGQALNKDGTSKGLSAANLKIAQNEIWGAWSRQKAPEVTVRYRGKEVSAAVPIYNKLQSIAVTSRTGALIEMNGVDKEYHRPDFDGEFLDQVKVDATYTLNSDATQTAVKEDVLGDVYKDINRSVTTAPDLIKNAATNRSANSEILTLDSVTAYLDKAKEQKVTVYYDLMYADTPTAEDPNTKQPTTSEKQSRMAINIGVTGDYVNETT